MTVEIRGLSEEARQRLQSLRTQSQRSGRRDVDVAASDGFAEVFAAIAATRIETTEPKPTIQQDPVEEPISAPEVAPVQADVSPARESAPQAEPADSQPTAEAAAETSPQSEEHADRRSATIDSETLTQAEAETDSETAPRVIEDEAAASANAPSIETDGEVRVETETGDDHRRQRTNAAEPAATTPGDPGPADESTSNPRDAKVTDEAPVLTTDRGVEVSETVTTEIVPQEDRRKQRTAKTTVDSQGTSPSEAVSELPTNKTARPSAKDLPAMTSDLEASSTQSKPTPTTAPPPSVAAATLRQASVASAGSGSRNPGATGKTTAVTPNASVRGKTGEATEAKRPVETDNRGQLDRMARIRLIHRISRAFDAMGKEGGRIRMRLAPNELGSVQVDMRVRNKSVDATVIAESESAAAVLREHLPELRSRLERMDLQVDRLEIELDSDGMDDRPRSQTRSDDQHDTGRSWASDKRSAGSVGSRRGAIDLQPVAAVRSSVSGPSDWRF